MPRDRQIFCAVMLDAPGEGGSQLEPGDLPDGHRGGLQAYGGPYCALGRCLAGLNRRSSKNPGSVVSLS